VTTIYSGGIQVDRAQAVLDVHVAAIGTGRCVGCGAPAPCDEREEAALVFRRSLRLPRRTPDGARPELCGARRVGVRALLPVG
jgi:hypothetical protein